MRVAANEGDTIAAGESEMTTITLEEAQANLAGLITALKPGDEVLITQQDRPIARLTVEPNNTPAPRRPGSAIGKLSIVEDDDTPLEDFREYIP
jgi:antitoxin (DNA-binding transcriptional repressor) of toxin-antitoxin stability system